jgi:hypothetical protein
LVTTKNYLYLWVDMTISMHDSEPETFVLKTIPEKFSEILQQIDVSSTPKEIATDDVESDDYYSRVFSQTTIMVTNKGCLEVKGKNIDVIQILQKG